MDRLDATAIEIPGVEVLVAARCGSTNTELLARAPQACTLLAAEEQTAGRGRRGRRWLSEPGQAITFSLARRIARPLREIAAVSLVAGVACARALRALGAREVALKWPNDLVVGEAKLGGILVETRGDARGGASGTLAVVGVGINHLGGAALGARLRRTVASLDALLDPLPARNRVIGALGQALAGALEAFEGQGFDAARADWEALHAHAGRRLRVRLADGRTVSGLAAGLAHDGALQLRTRAGLRAVASGRVLSSRAP